MAISIEVIVFLLLVFITTRRYRSHVYFKYLPYLVVFAFMAIRYDYGDDRSYRAMFSYLHNGINENGIEPLYAWINKCLPNFGSVVVFASLIYVLVFYLVVSRVLTYKQRGLALLVLTLHPYILFVDMSAIRQSVAIALIVAGVYFANEYNRGWFIPFCILAALFHKSAIVLVPIFFLFGKHHFLVKTKLVIVGGTAFFLLMSDKLFRLLEIVLSVLKLNSANYLSYLYNGNENSGLAVALSFIVMAFFMLCGDAVDEKKAIYVKLSILAMVFEALQGRVQQFGRIDMYFLPFLVLSLPLILKNETKTLQVKMLKGSHIFNKYGCWLVEACFIAVFIWKLFGFMTPQFAYCSLFTTW